MKFNKKNIIFILSIILSIVCSWLFVRKIDWSLLKDALKEANYWYVIPTLILTLLVYVVRALRWQGLLSHIKPVSVLNLLSITCIGFMANNILPARVGEVLRPFILYKKENVKFSTSVATVIVERIFDMLGLIIFTVAVIALLPHPTHHNTAIPLSANEANTIRESVIPSLKKWTEVFAAVGVLTIVSLFLIVIKPDFFKKVLSKMCFFLPHKLKDKVFGFSFHMHLPFMGACLVAICLALAVALPQAPGYIGVFHIAILKSLDIFGIETTAAQSYAIVLWAISILPSTLMGFFFLWREGIAFREVVKLEEEIVEVKLEEMEGITEDTK